jgi:hypothetical protein
MRSIPSALQEQTMKRDHDCIEARARRRVGRKIGFYVHAFVYLIVNLGLYAFHQLTGEARWHHWPLMGWGLGLAIHGIVVFMSLHTEGLRLRMLENEIQALQRSESR